MIYIKILKTEAINRRTTTSMLSFLFLYVIVSCFSQISDRMVEGLPKAHLQNGHHVPGSLWDTLWKYPHMGDMINDVFYTQQLKSLPEVKLRECWMEWGWRRTFNCEKRTPNTNTLEQINNNNHNNIYVGLDNDFMKNDHIVCTLKETLLIILLYT